MTTTAIPDTSLLREAATRRTFAIISHPDAGKTTLTEKLLLYAGAVGEAGAVQSRKRERAATSDWMELERRRGISISSTVLHFAYRDWHCNLLDTPGHADFSEDTYRTLCAADAAIMVLDLAKGLEPQTRKLFAVCRRRGLPVVTFVNKCDRPGLPPLEILDQIEAEMDLVPVPLTWPVGDGAEFAGIVDRLRGELVRFDRSGRGSRIGDEERVPLEKAEPVAGASSVARERFATALEEVELLAEVSPALDREAFLAGRQTPVFFGSALANFGVRLLLEGFAELAPSPGPAVSATGEPRPLDGPFAAQVFKVQANMDPRHRDRMAFMRVASGRFERGMVATQERSGRPFALKYAHTLFARDRETVDAAVPGDIVGVVGAGDLRVGDTLYVDRSVRFPPIPTFAPERFAVARNRDTGKAKQFRSGLVRLDEEGVVHVLRRPDYGDREPILAGVGQLQFEVATYRMATEFGCEVMLTPAPYEFARVVAAADAPALRNRRGVTLAEDAAGRTLALFANDHALRWLREDLPDLELGELGIAAE